jgi:hypothetical protein
LPTTKKSKYCDFEEDQTKTLLPIDQSVLVVRLPIKMLVNNKHTPPCKKVAVFFASLSLYTFTNVIFTPWGKLTEVGTRSPKTSLRLKQPTTLAGAYTNIAACKL